MPRIGSFDFAAQLWLYPGEGGWHFVSLPDDVSADIADSLAGIRRGFGSVRVDATVGATSWRTSIFPDPRSRAYVLPVKRAVRTAEHLDADNEIRVHLEILDP